MIHLLLRIAIGFVSVFLAVAPSAVFAGNNERVTGLGLFSFTLYRNETWQACKAECGFEPECKAWSLEKKTRRCDLITSIDSVERKTGFRSDLMNDRLPKPDTNAAAGAVIDLEIEQVVSEGLATPGTQTAYCPTNKRIISGGCAITSGGQITATRADSSSSWSCTAIGKMPRLSPMPIAQTSLGKPSDKFTIMVADFPGHSIQASPVV